MAKTNERCPVCHRWKNEHTEHFPCPMKDVSCYKPRNDFVLLRIVYRDKTEGGVILSDDAEGSKDLYVAAIGPKVENLEVGDVVLLLGASTGADGSVTETYAKVPRQRDLLLAREGAIACVIKE